MHMGMYENLSSTSLFGVKVEKWMKKRVKKMMVYNISNSVIPVF